VTDLISTLRQRIRISPSESSVSGSLPVIFFGDALSARVATIGLNPSKFEYLDRTGIMLSGREQRFASTVSLGAVSREGLSDAQADEAIEVMRSYYDDGKPVYGSYFRHLKNFLAGMGASYAGRSATHLDLVQEPTDPVWNGLISSERSALMERDMPFLIWQLENLPRLEAVICAGKTVSEQLRAHVCIDVKDTGATKRIRWWLGTAHLGQRDLPIGGWNYPLDRPTGLGTAGEIGLGKMFAQALL
jgi:uracil-DNA glycosylase